jgi:drug/metabolite transporter (DMT)-like permease
MFDGFKSVPGMKATSIGAFFGPVLGVSLSLVAAKYTSLGVAATLMGIVPVIVIPVSVMIFKERVNSREVVGALIAVVGVALLVM